MERATHRRDFLGGISAVAIAGCMSSTSANSTDNSDPVEKGGVELANIQPQPLESYNGISAVVYNGNSEQKTVTVEFTAYDSAGNQLHNGTDSVSVESKMQAPVSKYWEKSPDDSPFQGWDAKIVSVE